MRDAMKTNHRRDAENAEMQMTYYVIVRPKQLICTNIHDPVSLNAAKASGVLCVSAVILLFRSRFRFGDLF